MRPLEQYQLDAWLGPAYDELTDGERADLLAAYNADPDRELLEIAQELYPNVFPESDEEMPEEFRLIINVDNAAFADNAGPEVARILRMVAAKLDSGMDDGKCYDVNGNAVGHYGVVVEGPTP